MMSLEILKGIWAAPVLASVLILGALGFTQDAFAADFNSVASGLWSDPATWDAGAIPPSFDPAVDTITIKSGHTVTLNFNSYIACNDDITVESGATLLIPVPGILTFVQIANNCDPSSLTNRGLVVDDNTIFDFGLNSFRNEGFLGITGAFIMRSDFVNTGTINILAYPFIDSLGRLDIDQPGGSLTNDCGGFVNLSGGARFQSALLRTADGGTATNYGIMNLIGGTGQESGSWQNEADIQNYGIINQNTGSGLNSGRINHVDGGTLTDNYGDFDSDGVNDACDPDDDNDGIPDNLDTETAIPPTVFDFTDGTIFGTILSGNSFLTITDDPANGISIAASGPVTVNVCGIATLSLSAGDSIDVKCGSVTIEVVSGSVILTLDDTGLPPVTINEGSNVTVDSEGTITNNGPADIEVLIDGNPVTIGLGQTIEISPTPTFESLIEQVQVLELHHGIENALTKKIENAQADFEAGNIDDAADKLNAFINQVNAQSGKKIAAADADDLIESAQELIDAL